MQINKNHRAVIAHINGLLGIDVAPYSCAIRRSMINVDISNFDRPDRVEQAIRRIAAVYGKIKVSDNGGHGIAVALT
jgi:hypothetical protein